MVYACITRENAVGTADTATALTELSGNSPGTVTIPAASLLTGIYISIGMDWTADAAYAVSSAIRLSGSGISGYQSYPGPCLSTLGVATGSSGSNICPPQKYKTKIPVTPGQGIDIDGFLHGEDGGEMHMAVTLEFDGVPGMIRDMDYREENLTAANTAVTLGAKLGAAHAYIHPSTLQIGEVHVNGANKAIAGPLGAPTLFELFGAALPKGGGYQFQGPGFATQDDLLATTSSGGAGSGHSNSVAYHIPLGKCSLTPGNTFQAQATMIEDDVGTIMAIIGIGYL